MFHLVTRCAGESNTAYKDRFWAKFSNLNDLYPENEKQSFTGGISFYFGGRHVAYFRFPEERKRKIKRWSEE